MIPLSFGKVGQRSAKQSGRQWLHLTPRLSEEPCFHLRVLSYNLLAPCYMHKKFFPFSSKESLLWPNRSHKILQEIKSLSCPEIMCFQEYQKIYTDHIWKTLRHSGYKHLVGYKRRKQEGLAIFYKEDHFTCLYEGYLDLNIAKQLKLFYQFDFDTCALFCLLRSTQHPDQHFLVVNTHLLYAPTRGNEKLAEVVVILKTIEQIKVKYKDLLIHVIFNGDFNFLPSSALYNFMADGLFFPNQFSEHNYSSQLFNQGLNNMQLSDSEHFFKSTRKIQPEENMYTLKSLKNKELFENICRIEVELGSNIRLHMSDSPISGVQYSESGISSSLVFKSAYSSFYKEYSERCPASRDSTVSKYMRQVSPEKRDHPMTWECSQTQLASSFRATVDYIWTLSDSAKPTSIYQGLDYTDQYFPNEEFPSDHQSLCTDLMFRL